MVRKIAKVVGASILAGLGLAWSWAMGEAPQGMQAAEAVTAGLLIGGAVLGGLGGMSSANKAKSQAKRSRRLLRRGIRRAKQILSPQYIIQQSQKLNPLLRELVASGQGPQFQQNVASLLARRGLTGTGIGTALSSAALGAPGIFAAQQSFGAAMALASQRAGIEIGAGQALAQAPQGPTGGGFASGAAQGLFMGAQALGQLNRQPQSPLMAVPAGPPVVAPAGNVGTGGGVPPFAVNTLPFAVRQ